MSISAVRRLCLPILAIAVTIVLLVLSAGESNAGLGSPVFQPVFDAKLCNDLKATFKGPAELKGTQNDAQTNPCTPVTTPSGHPDITNPFVVPAFNLAYDQAFFLVTGGANETRLSGAQIPGPNPGGQTGAPAGGLESEVTLGLATNPCNNTIRPDFIWWESEYSVTNTVACAVEGTDNRWNNIATDGGDAFPGQADKGSLIVTKYPDCIMKMFDPDGDGIDNDGNQATLGDQPVQPRARFAGLTQVPPGGDWQMLNNIEFEPGALKAAFLANPNTTKHPYTKLDASLGYVNIVQLNDPTTVILQPNPISDFCALVSTKGMLKGQIDTNNDGVVDLNRVTSPATPGSQYAQSMSRSYRDADGDGLENPMDTCQWIANIDNPWNYTGADADMLDPACDPFPAALDADEDNDGYLNNQDLCPLVANPLPAGETDNENTQLYNVSAPDGGPPQDFIGDDCDSEGGGNDNVSNGLFITALHPDSVCITGGAVVDADGDGWCAAQDPSDGDANNPGQMTHVKVDSAGAPALDSDGDGYTNLNEWSRIRSDPAYKCPKFSGKHDAWPPDFDMNRVINITDVFKVLPPTFGTTPASATWDARRDLSPDNVINITDVFKVLPPTFGTSCTPPA